MIKGLTACGYQETGIIFLILLAYLEFSLSFLYNKIDTETTPNRATKPITKED